MMFVLLLLIIIFYGPIKRSSMRGTDPNIKYGRQEYIRNLRAFVVFLILTLIAFGYLVSPIVEKMGSGSMEVSLLIAWFLSGIGVIMVVMEGARSFMSYFYLKRLKRYGYEIPKSKNDYYGRVRNLPRREGVYPNHVGSNRESMTLTGLSLVAGGITAVCSFIVWWQYMHTDQELAMEGLVLLLFPLICWLICSFVFWRQRLPKKYRDDIEIGDNRKLRAQLEEGIVEIMGFAGLTAVYMRLVILVLEIFEKSRA